MRLLPIFIALFLFGIEAGIAAPAEEWPTPQTMIDSIGAELQLSGQQKLDLQIIAADYEPRLRDLVKIGRGIADSLLSVSTEAPDYIDRTQSASAAAAATTAELVVLLAEMRGKLFAVLTPEQRVQARTLIAERREKMRQKIDEKKRSKPTAP